MTIAIDYDGTMKGSSDYCERECAMWSAIIGAFTDAGHTVIIATSREGFVEDGHEITGFLNRAGLMTMPVIWCGGELKTLACRERGYHVDVWIDDMPEMIGGTARLLEVHK